MKCYVCANNKCKHGNNPLPRPKGIGPKILQGKALKDFSKPLVPRLSSEEEN